MKDYNLENRKFGQLLVLERVYVKGEFLTREELISIIKNRLSKVQEDPWKEFR